MKANQDILAAALKYQRMGLSVIPVKGKRALNKWAEFQNRVASEEEVRRWFQRWPDANIAIVTGEISGVDVLDCDSDAGRDALNEFLSDTLITPVAKTPKGYHFYFKHTPGLKNGVRVIHECDPRTTGGYVVAPPSIGEDGQRYQWLEGLSLG